MKRVHIGVIALFAALLVLSCGGENPGKARHQARSRSL
jgi:hypothetical protein